MIKHGLYILLTLGIVFTFMNASTKRKTEWDKLAKNHEWFLEKSTAYNPDSSILEKIQLKENQSWIIFAGTWCSDTKHLLPRFHKIAMLKGWKLKNIPLHMLDMDKKSKKGHEKPYAIEHIPTFILLENGKEIGRIVETVPVSMEVSIWELLK
jgi:thiol-disulfide isomerase/thioredoxin